MVDEIERESVGERVFGSQIQGRVAIHPSVEIRDSIVRGPVSIGPRVSISNAFIGPYTSIAPGVQIESVEIEDSLVLDDAQIRFLDMRVDGSVIGPRAKLIRDAPFPARLAGLCR
jgi:glucose-1-phosphate thymidylyltransferase